MPESWPQVLQEALKLPSLLVEIYGDLARPGVRQVGKALETVLGFGNTILWPLAYANERTRLTLDKNLEKYRQKLESTPDEKIVPVAPEVGVPIAEKLSYVTDEKLSDLYIQLLAKASVSDKVDQAHPSFVNVINNLSPDEATLLEYFTKSNDLPFLRAKAVSPSTLTFSLMADLIVTENIALGLRFPRNIGAYFSNLSGLGLVTIHHGTWIEGSPIYEEIETQNREVAENHLKSVAAWRDKKLEFERSVIVITSFGRQFIRACHDE